jgi:hypothetical protein
MATEVVGEADESVSTAQASPRAKDAERSARRSKRPSGERAINAIQATRKARKNRTPIADPARSGENAPAPDTGTRTPMVDPVPPSARVTRADSDPWTVPQSVRDRFVQDGHRFYFPDGAAAFRDLGRKLTTASENTQIVHSLIEIAQSRGWTEVTVTGTERFRQEAWRQARLAGLAVRGYRPSEAEHAQLIRALDRNRSRLREQEDAISAGAAPSLERAAQGPHQAASGGSQETSATGGGPREPPTERFVGRLLDHGRDAYRHDPKEDPSYFVRLQTRAGEREIWGSDIERAIANSLTQPQIGDEVILRRSGRKAVTVKRHQRDALGEIKDNEVQVFRNRWVLEKREFFTERAKAAQMVLDPAIGPPEAVRQHPELAGTYLSLRAAELAARVLRDPQDRRRFVSQVRSVLADDIERGEPLQPVRLRERTARETARPLPHGDRAQVR